MPGPGARPPSSPPSGGEAAALGHSSGAVLALLAAAEGVPVRHLFLSEPPFRFGDDEPRADLPERLQALVDDGRPDEAVTLFQREGVGLVVVPESRDHAVHPAGTAREVAARSAEPAPEAITPSTPALRPRRTDRYTGDAPPRRRERHDARISR